MTNLANQIAALSAAATGGTWIAARRSSIVGRGIVSSPEGRMIGNIVEHDDAPENAALIVALRNAVPHIVAALNAQAEVEALRARVAELEGHLSNALEALAYEGCCAPDCVECGSARKALEAKL